MADILDIVIIPTYDEYTLAIVDNSSYDVDPATPQIEIEVPAFDTVTLPFVINSTNIFDSTELGITTTGNEQALPDGIYCIKYFIDESTYVEKRILRTEKLQKKFDEAFMTLDMMECDRAIKTQSKMDLITIYIFIQAAIASANNCAPVEATSLYQQADKMLDNMINSQCGCTGINYIINFQ